MTQPPQIDADDLEVPEELRDFANMMVEEVMATLRAKILNGGWSPSEQTEVLDCVIAEQKVKHKYRNAITTLRAEKQALVDANTRLLHEINAHKDALADAEGTISELQSALRDS